MPEAVRLAGSCVLAAVLAWTLVPVAIRIALRTGFLDVPKGYKGHARATPYLGGAAVLTAFLLTATVFSGALDRFAPVLGCALLLFAVGTLDDRINLGPGIRVLVEIGVAVVLWQTGLGWTVFGDDAANLLLTIVWVVGILNAFNLMDNMDGASSTVAAMSCAGVAMVALVIGDVMVAALALAIVGACAGFLPHNLARPSRIFLGDGGSMPLGFLVASMVMALPFDGGLGWTALLVAAPLVGLPILDTTLVCISRRRRGVAILRGGRDHLTHRLRERLGTAQMVALALAVAQGALCALAVGLATADPSAVIAVAGLYVAGGSAVIYGLEMPTVRRAVAPATTPATMAVVMQEE